MGKIKTLPEKVVNQIAAGEVVERPSSVVKELVENALDAKATFIEVEVQEGGSKLIKVTDNGEGMGPEDARLAVQKHATSKIFSADDLSRLHTFGFRGEALASIASVSHFELSTRVPEALSGLSIKIKGGGTAKELETGRPAGTTISISNLFFNTPARMKFMKKQATEENHIVMVMTTYALAFPQVGFKLTIDGKETLQVTASDFAARLSKIFGKDLSASFLPVDYKTPSIQVTGVVSAPTITKPTRENMLYFVNRRWISNPSLGHAVMTAFHTLLPTRRFPVAVLFIEVPEDQVDVNVHPTKREVKFAKDREVYEAIVRAIRNALLATTGNLASPPAEFQVQSAVVAPYDPSMPTQPLFASEGIIPRSYGTSAPSLYERLAQKHPDAAPSSYAPAHGDAFESYGLGKDTLQARRIDPQVSLYNFSQLFNTFIVFQSDSEMFIADQHTVHERLNYERLMKAVREKKLEVQPLLVPVTVELTAKEAQVLRNNLETLLELGVEAAPFGGNTFLIRSVPADLAGKNLVSLMKDLVDDLAAQDAMGVKGANKLDQARERAATFMSCRSAVMAGDRLSDDQMKGLINRMREANLPFTCPHGRPTILSIPLTELYRRFDRH
ncbi:MAG TPA: DNA mismatch repair endonuclease MutL [bacterium]|nr:DNA mismatch repair endonuclease MutL [bacterium]